MSSSPWASPRCALSTDKREAYNPAAADFAGWPMMLKYQTCAHSAPWHPLSHPLDDGTMTRFTLWPPASTLAADGAIFPPSGTSAKTAPVHGPRPSSSPCTGHIPCRHLFWTGSLTCPSPTSANFQAAAWQTRGENEGPSVSLVPLPGCRRALKAKRPGNRPALSIRTAGAMCSIKSRLPAVVEKLKKQPA